MDASQQLNEQARRLRVIAANTGIAVGSGGFKRHGVETVTTVKYNVLVVQEDT